MTLKEAILEYVDDVMYFVSLVGGGYSLSTKNYGEEIKERFENYLHPVYVPNKGKGVYYLWEGRYGDSWHGSTSLDTYKVFNFKTEEGAIHYMDTLFPDYKRVYSDYELKEFRK